MPSTQTAASTATTPTQTAAATPTEAETAESLSERFAVTEQLRQR